MRTACGINAECKVRSHIKQCSCPPGFTGNSEVECVRRKCTLLFILLRRPFIIYFSERSLIRERFSYASPSRNLSASVVPVSCLRSEDCNGGNTCRENVCLPTCAVDNDCALNEKCIHGNCLLTCRLDNDCFLGHICLHNMCSFGCRADEDCNANEACLGNKCVNPCEATPCGPNAKCTVFNQRATCSCPTGFIPNPTAKIACLRLPGPVCQTNRDCATGAACIAGVCTPVCSTGANCLSNERCDSAGICKSLCRRDEDCRSGEICEGLMCVSGCRADIECQNGYACINNQCIGENPLISFLCFYANVFLFILFLFGYTYRMYFYFLRVFVFFFFAQSVYRLDFCRSMHAARCLRCKRQVYDRQSSEDMHVSVALSGRRSRRVQAGVPSLLIRVRVLARANLLRQIVLLDVQKVR